MNEYTQLCLKRALATSQEERDHITQQIDALDRGELPPAIEGTYERIGKYEKVKRPWTKSQVRGWKILGAVVLSASIASLFWPQETPWRSEYLQQRLDMAKDQSRGQALNGCYSSRELRYVLTERELANIVQAAVKTGFYDLGSLTYCFNEGSLTITQHGKELP